MRLGTYSVPGSKWFLFRGSLIRIDFKGFFPSIVARDVERVLRQELFGAMRLSDEDVELITKLVCKDRALTIGAPSSPVLSNAIMYEFDAHWAQRARQSGIVYSRYADDLYFSTNTPNILAGTLEDIRAFVAQQQSPLLSINDKKSVYTSRKRHRMVTGLVLTPDRRVSLGRARRLESRPDRRILGSHSASFHSRE